MSEAQVKTEYSLLSKLAAEFLGTAGLLIAVIGPMVLFNVVIGAKIEIAILVDALAVVFILYVLIETFGPISGAHFNPVVSTVMVILGKLKAKDACLYIPTQIIGAITGVALAQLMFYSNPGLNIILTISKVQRSGSDYLGEFLGTFTLLMVILILVHRGSKNVPIAVAFIVGSFFFATSSTMFANPAVTLARMLTYTAAGVRPMDGLVFIVMEFIGGLTALAVWKLFFQTPKTIIPQ